MKELIGEIEKWSEKYDITFQFWKNNNTVYIEVDLVDLFESGGHEKPINAVYEALNWIYTKNRTPFKDRVSFNVVCDVCGNDSVIEAPSMGRNCTWCNPI